MPVQWMARRSARFDQGSVFHAARQGEWMPSNVTAGRVESLPPLSEFVSAVICVEGADAAAVGLQVPTLCLQLCDGQERLWADGPDRTISFAPQNISLVLVPDDADDELLLRVAAWMSRQSLDVPVVPANATMLGSIRSLLAHRHVLAKQTADALLQLARLRAVHEQLQNAYSSLRTFVGELGLPHPLPVFHSPPDEDAEPVTTPWKQLQQPLPVDGRVLCGVSIRIASTSEATDMPLTVEVMAADDDSLSVKRLVPVADFREGWLTFVFDPLPAAAGKRLALGIRCPIELARPPGFSLGVRQPHSGFRLSVDGRNVDRSLALKCWATVPGAPLMATEAMAPTCRLDGPPLATLAVAFGPMLDVQDVFRSCDTVEDFRPVELLDSRTIVVHPLGHRPTVARLPGCIPTGTRTIRAEVITAHEAAGTVDYGIACAPPARFHLDAAGTPTGGSLWSGWVSVPPNIVAHVDLALPKPSTEPHDLYLMTRTLASGMPDYAWAHFKAITVRGKFAP